MSPYGLQNIKEFYIVRYKYVLSITFIKIKFERNGFLRFQKHYWMALISWLTYFQYIVYANLIQDPNQIRIHFTLLKFMAFNANWLLVIFCNKKNLILFDYVSALVYLIKNQLKVLLVCQEHSVNGQAIDVRDLSHIRSTVKW